MKEEQLTFEESIEEVTFEEAMKVKSLKTREVKSIYKE